MAASTVSLRYFVLGLLAQQAMSGYDIQRSLKGLSWLIGSPSTGSLYPILRALPEAGLATVETFASSDKPPKKVYTITEAGRHKLQAWIDQASATKVSLKAFVMRLLLAGSYSPAGLEAHLRQRRAQVVAHRDALHDSLKVSRETADSGQFLAMEYGLALATAELSWLDHTLDALSNQPLSQEDE